MQQTFAVLPAMTSVALAAPASGPQVRRPTDPKSIPSSPNPKAGPNQVEDLFYTARFLEPAWSPDGTQLSFTCDLTGRLNLWKMPVAGGRPVQLVRSDDRQLGGLWSKDGRWIVYREDRAGGEYFDLYAIPSEGGAPINLTRTSDIAKIGRQFSPDGMLLALEHKLKAGSSFNIAVLDWQTKQVRTLTDEREPDRTWLFSAWSPDSRAIYAARVNLEVTDSDICQIDIASGRTENLTAHQGEIVWRASAVSPDGKTLLVTSSAKNGAHNVALLDVESKGITWVTDTGWEASSSDFSPDGKLFTYTLNADGRTEAYLVDRATLRSQKLDFPPGASFPTGRPSSFSPDGRFLLVQHESSRRPGDFWLYDVAARCSRQITFATVTTLDPQSIPEAQLVHYRSFDGKIISALLWVPSNLQRDASHPGIVVPHGGPAGQVADRFYPLFVALASRGFVIIAPNFRGSTGYGLEFQKANVKDLGGGDLQDVVYAADFMVETGYVNPKKIGITGGSYGGFLTLMAIGKTPDRWAAAVSRCGVIDWFTMLKFSDPIIQQDVRSFLGDPDKDRQIYEDASPLKYLRNAKAPLLVLQGADDIRVTREQAEQAVDLLKRERRIVEVQYYAAEGHGLAKRENQIDALTRTIAWFDKYLKHE